MTEPRFSSYNNHTDERGAHRKFLGDNVTGAWLPGFEVVESFMTVNRPDVVRGMHFQSRFPQQKLISLIEGRVVVNIVKVDGSEVHTALLEADSFGSAFCPAGYALGYRSLGESKVLYLADAPFVADDDTGFNALQFDWTLDNRYPLVDPILSPRDIALPPLLKGQR